MDDLIGYLVTIALVVAVVVAVVIAVLSFGGFILGGIAAAGMVTGAIKGTNNFFIVLKEAHDRLP